MEPTPHPISPVIWRIELLGTLAIHGHNVRIDHFPTQKVAALLAILAYAPGKRHAREKLVDELWPDAEPDAARNRLSQALVWLRPQLEPGDTVRGSVLIADRATISLDPNRITTDVTDFNLALAEADQARSDTDRHKAISHAVELYRGDLLPEIYSDWVLTERRILQHNFVLALRRLSALHEAGGEYEAALGYARRAVAADPVQEEAHCDIIRLLAASGQAAAALRQYEELKRLLSKEFGALPSPAAEFLVDQIRKTKTVTQPAPRLARRVAPLPAPLTRLFGRDVEIERVRQTVLTGETRLVTIIGPGGCGKTRLALAAGSRLVGEYPGAVAFVPLADLDDPQMIPAAISAALRLPGNAGASALEQIGDALSGEPFLLILDNLEHLAAGAAPLARELLARVPKLTVLMTSRQRLNLEGEREITVAPLDLPSLSSPTPDTLRLSASAQLFLDRAQAVRPQFEITPENAATIAQVCERLEGIPLAIELCAAWAQALTPAQMLEKLNRRFDLLVSRSVDTVQRHRTLRAALEYSFVQMPDGLQSLFKMLSAFRGSWSLEAAEIIWRDMGPSAAGISPDYVLEALTELRERSLIWTEDAGAEMRFRMLDSLREFAAEQLSSDEVSRLRAAHAVFYLQLARTADRDLGGPNEDDALSRLDWERENFRAALTWALETERIEPGLRLATALGRYWSIRGSLHEGRLWLDRLLENAVSPIDSQLEAKALSVLGHLRWALGDYGAARDLHERSLAIRRRVSDDAGIEESLYYLGITAYREDDYDTAAEYLKESLAIAEARSDNAGIARVLLNLGNIGYERKLYSEARSYIRRSLEIEERLGNRRRCADAMNNLGLIARDCREYDLANRLFQDALAIRQNLKDNFGTAYSLANLGSIALLQGNLELAKRNLSDGLRLAYDVGNKHVLGFHLQHLSMLAFAQAWHTHGVTLAAAAERIFREIGSSSDVVNADEASAALSEAHENLPGEDFALAWSHGQSASLGEIVQETLTAFAGDDDTA